ncbi:hypothetical protein [Ruania alba]|uniref:Uncharacterized protein n=1 Tax=Ruania alba TaxID=648782 RepID=A0A1H5M3I5_9MICO|nr:hypothetical protein [Ruania alba]SEE83780.1 hypothetical protein SAMN04488554_3127 [Ruania alba]
MYSGPANSTTLAATGFGITAATGLYWFLALVAIGGALAVAGKLTTRLALEPVQGADGQHRLRFTRNGQPLR